MEINYTFYFFAFLKKVIKKLLTFCYWQNGQVDPYFLCFQTGSFDIKEVRKLPCMTNWIWICWEMNGPLFFPYYE